MPADVEVLLFERDRAGRHVEDEIRRRFGSPARYYQRLRRALEDPEVLAAEPMLVHRLQRVRDRRADARAQRHL